MIHNMPFSFFISRVCLERTLFCFVIAISWPFPFICCFFQIASQLNCTFHYMCLFYFIFILFLLFFYFCMYFIIFVNPGYQRWALGFRALGPAKYLIHHWITPTIYLECHPLTIQLSLLRSVWVTFLGLKPWWATLSTSHSNIMSDSTLLLSL